jgi:DMSO/TMAO reductase YedYZ heme-binding membrane subunit
MIGVRRWRFLHRFVLAFYGLSLWHALILGLDVGAYSWVRPAIWVLQVPLLILLIRRLRSPLRSDRKLSPGQRLTVLAVRYGLQAASATAIAAIAALVLTGQSGFIATV